MREKQYDLAVSFAGEQRAYVADTVAACKELGLKVFYDKDKNNDWWGGSFIREQRVVYSSKTRFFVPFLSTEYLSKPIPQDEFSAAMMTAVKQGDPYILPVLFGDVKVPADLLHPHIHYLHAADYTPETLARELVKKVGKSAESGTHPAGLGPVVENAMQLRLPKVVPDQWSKYEELGRVFDHLVTRFAKAGPELRPQGFIVTNNRNQDRLRVRVERGGNTVFGLNISKGGGMGDDQITWLIGYDNYSENSFHGWATPEYDKDRQTPVMAVTDFANFGSNSDHGLTAEEFFQFLWDKMIDALERS